MRVPNSSNQRKLPTFKRLKTLQSELASLDRRIARMTLLERKQDTRRKIQLGGLVKKAALDEEPTAVLLGLLLEAAEKLQSEQSESIRENWRLLGDIALTKETKDG